MCIAAAVLIGGGIERASAGKRGPRGQYNTLLLAAVLVVAALGVSASAALVHWDSICVLRRCLLRYKTMRILTRK